uniref:Uncharacterized protein n=1 Tax=Anguilla anguilla TaxID=7936 RepID=A0A0E9XQM1_ANGAN
MYHSWWRRRSSSRSCNGSYNRSCSGRPNRSRDWGRSRSRCSSCCGCSGRRSGRRNTRI